MKCSYLINDRAGMTVHWNDLIDGDVFHIKNLDLTYTLNIWRISHGYCYNLFRYSAGWENCGLHKTVEGDFFYTIL